MGANFTLLDTCKTVYSGIQTKNAACLKLTTDGTKACTCWSEAANMTASAKRLSDDCDAKSTQLEMKSLKKTCLASFSACKKAGQLGGVHHDLQPGLLQLELQFKHYKLEPEHNSHLQLEHKHLQLEGEEELDGRPRLTGRHPRPDHPLTLAFDSEQYFFSFFAFSAMQHNHPRIMYL